MMDLHVSGLVGCPDVAETLPAASRQTDPEAWRPQQAFKLSEDQYRLLVENSLDMVTILTPDGIVLYESPSVKTQTGYEPVELVGQSAFEFIHPDDRAGVATAIRRALANGEPAEVEFRLRHKDGSWLYCEGRGQPLDDAGGPRFLANTRNITARKNAEDRLRLLSTALASAANAVVITDRQGRIQWVNNAFTRLSGYTEAELLGQTPHVVHSRHHDRAFFEHMWGTILRGEVWSGEVVERRKDGTTYVVNQTITPLRDADGAVSHFVAVHEDITARKQAEGKAAHMALHDALTGLPNRVLLRNRLEQGIIECRRRRSLLGLMYLDLDRFKTINDTLGHAVGDGLLQAVAQRLRRALRSSDTISRLGGDEFAVLLPDLRTPADAAAVGRQLVEVLAVPFQIHGNEVHTSTSIGITIYPTDHTEAEELVKNADLAMYEAKHRGRNLYCFFSEELNQEVRSRMAMESALRAALQHGELFLEYQPLVGLARGNPLGVEALVRWRHPTKGLVGPDQFIPVAEESGLINPLSNWVLHKACLQARQWQDEGLAGFRVAVNIASAQFRQDGFLSNLEETLADTGLTPEHLELELTETTLMQDMELAISLLHELHRRGIQIAIDDFGMGYSSLNYLRRLPADKLKIDRVFVRGLGQTEEDGTIVKAIIDLAHHMKMRVLAEGVETAAQRHFLLDHACEEAQGFLFARPLAADDVVSWFANARKYGPYRNVLPFGLPQRCG